MKKNIVIPTIDCSHTLVKIIIICDGSQACKLDLETKMTCELMMLEVLKLYLSYQHRVYKRYVVTIL